MFKRGIIVQFSILLFTLLLSFVGWNQRQDFNAFRQIQSEGKIPDDFILSSSDKVRTDMQEQKGDLGNLQKRIFLEGIHYGIDEMLQSGLVIYGDEISNYVNKVAQKILKNDRKLLEKLRFYTIKSNSSNAFSTDQGIVFFTTGLISQLTSEAQLAFIIGHEISHYTEEHVVEGFQYRSRNKGISDQVKQLSIYSKDKEFEADELGLKWYHKAGYSKEAVVSTFDVLMYSYLPIDEIEMPKTYFNSDLCFVPENKFSEKKFPIQAIEDYDDSESSHPNIKSRKEKMLESASKLKDWGTATNFIGQEEFEYIRDLARFERVRTDILEAAYAKALYTIFILEKKYPKSLYLDRMKAQCWLGLTVFKNGNSINKAVENKSDLEGEGAAIHVFIKNLKANELASLSMRIIEDLRKNNPKDKEINTIWERMVREFSRTSRVNLDEFSTNTFNQALRTLKDRDTTGLKAQQIAEDKLSKYEKIKLQQANPTSKVEKIDSSNYYLYNLSDLMQSESFRTTFVNYQNKAKAIEDAKEDAENLSKKEYEKWADEQSRIDLSSFILVEPAAISYKKNKVSYSKSDELTEKFKQSFQMAAEELDLKMYQVNKGNLDTKGTTGFNEKSLFTSLLIQLSEADMNIFPVDFSYLDEIRSNYGTNKLVFSIIQHKYSVGYNREYGALGILFLPIYFLSGNTTEIDIIVLDLENLNVTSTISARFNEPTSQMSILARIYDLMSNLNLKK